MTDNSKPSQVKKNKTLSDLSATADALSRSQAVIEFTPTGEILFANENFLQTLGYELKEIKGKHHSIFVPEAERDSKEYATFWSDLEKGAFSSGEYKRITKSGDPIWIEATYNPVINEDGVVYKVVKYASDITERKIQSVRNQGQLDAISRSQAVIEFEPNGTIIHANQNFLDGLGYQLDEIKGNHHRMFVRKEEHETQAYQQFWKDLADGEFKSAEYRRVRKDGSDIWIQATYNPIVDLEGKVTSVVKFATDITESKVNSNFTQGQIDAINRAQAVIQFMPDGTIVTANQNFLDGLGYTLDEIKGQHHRMFMRPDDRNAPEYSKLWSDLANGQFQSAEYRRIRKDGSDIWIQATYNPIMDLDGNVSRVVKFATDITERKVNSAFTQGQIDAINRAQAVIEFHPDGTIVEANENFLQGLGYRLQEITGKHHSMFVDPADAATEEYKNFWKKLAQGQFQQSEYRRIRKDGSDIWIQATYNPILDLDGRVSRVVKFATDITEEVKRRQKTETVARQIDNDLNSIADGIAQSTQRTTSVATATNQASSSVQAVAAAAEQLSASASEISHQLGRATEITREAVGKANATNDIVGGLTESARKISEVVNLINDIAEQTNLLALNATIEAARAGEAGKGFAVVASEVKNLAIQSSKATEEISGQIQHVQGVAEKAAEAIASIGGTISEIDDVASSVAGAVEEQSSVTNEITANMAELSGGVETINQSIQEMAVSSQEIQSATENVRLASSSMI